MRYPMIPFDTILMCFRSFVKNFLHKSVFVFDFSVGRSIPNVESTSISALCPKVAKVEKIT